LRIYPSIAADAGHQANAAFLRGKGVVGTEHSFRASWFRLLMQKGSQYRLTAGAGKL